MTMWRGCAILLPGLLGTAAQAQQAGQLPAPWQMPVASGCLSSPFGPRHYVGPQAPAGFHTGVDLPAPAGGAVHAVAEGEVLSIHKRGAGGLEVAVRHGPYVALYSHLGRVTPALAEGARHLAPGQEVGVVGRTGVTYGTHLFFEIMLDGKPVDPAPLLHVLPCRR